jgi:hypothetical protein
LTFVTIVGLIHVKRDEGAKLASGVTSDDVFGAPGELLRGFKHFVGLRRVACMRCFWSVGFFITTEWI